ncbi:neuropeptide Y receptor type 6 [Hydra vulgaris]|uniref:Neuropeptide Y receptor type 6 n=1 Tax=Hydra vulgaris TaxID=6087 RepID=A0ABM4D656_HYDVU
MFNKTFTKGKAPPIYLASMIGYSVLFFATVGTLANILVLIVLFLSKKSRTSHYKRLISHLTLTDLLCCILLYLYVPVELFRHNWQYAKSLCKLIYPGITLCTNLSVGTILMITLERYRGVILPHLTPWRRCNVSVALVAVWIFCLIIIIPNIATLKVLLYEDKQYCNEHWQSKLLQKVYGISYFCLSFFLPFLAIAIMHGHIMYRLKNKELLPANISSWNQKSQNRITKVLTTVIFGFTICILPNKLLYLVWDIAPELEKKSNARFYLRTIQILYWSRVAIDPLLYCFLDTRFQKDLINMLKKIGALNIMEVEMKKTNISVLTSVRLDSLKIRSETLKKYEIENNDGVQKKNETPIIINDPTKSI